MTNRKASPPASVACSFFGNNVRHKSGWQSATPKTTAKSIELGQRSIQGIQLERLMELTNELLDAGCRILIRASRSEHV
jgi:hypothetical protein